MATVPDLAGASFNLVGRAVDRKLSSPNRWLSSTPYGTILPGYTGEMVQDTSTGQIWEATNLTNLGWIAVTVIV